ncbi:cell envelope biogenesis protein OmpA [Parazoarcus communis]|uniref:Cell envelope biogenesis protein OmpA n=1 Tax=Parazoarcus communis TaxID=41977 RepID=A0A2U8GKX5_9RHOO|nr:OmpA family protein [Parazoarcus communis]AWI74070.1 cell envelope biogenesis protein OmpA [Parazoarcus communis]
MNTITRRLAGIGFALALSYPLSCLAQSALPAPVILSGTVPDESSRAAIVASARTLYGTERVVDRLQVGGVTPPPNWSTHVQRLLGPDLKHVHQGELQVVGTRVTLRGKVANEALRQQVVSTTAASLTPAYVVNNALEVGANAQAVLDRTLADRVVEFESGSAVLTAQGRLLLDEMAASIVSLDTPLVQVVGHTDSAGNRLANIGLSLERANAVRDYLVMKGVAADCIAALGAGPDRPVADNASPEGRARNRRIEFRIGR